MDDKMYWVVLRETVRSIRELDVCEKSLALALQVNTMSNHWAEEIAWAHSYVPTRVVDDYIEYLEDWRKTIICYGIEGRYEQIRRDLPQIYAEVLNTEDSDGVEYCLIENKDGYVKIMCENKAHIIKRGIKDDKLTAFIIEW